MSDLLSHVNVAMLTAAGGPAISSKKAKRELILSQTASYLPDLMRQFSINTVLRIVHFLSQLAHESDGFHTTREYASGAAYEGRADLGNVRPGDGTRYRGRGLIQLTGRANYRKFTQWMRSFMPDAPDFEADPHLVEEFPWAVWSAIWYWDTRKLNAVADRDDLLTITRVINGGKNGLAGRTEKLGRAKAYFAKLDGGAVSAAQGGFQVMFRGVEGCEEKVARLQELLDLAGYYHGAKDGIFGAGTDTAVKAFQHNRQLKVDGVVGEKTWTSLTTLLGVAG